MPIAAAISSTPWHFEIRQIETGRYEFFASHIGYLEQQYKSKGVGDEQGAMLSLTSGQTVDDVMFRLMRAGVIAGKIVDDTGEPMMGVNVLVLRKYSDEERDEEGLQGKKLGLMTVSGAQTDDRGEYRAFNLKPGEYYVKAAETSQPWGVRGAFEVGSDWRMLHELGSQFAPIYYPGVLQLDQAQAITLRSGEEAQADVAMRRIKMVEVAGRVIGPDGAPAHVYVDLEPVDSEDDSEDWGSDLGTGTSSGEFSIKGVPPGRYFISAQTQESDKHYNTRQRIEVGEANIDGLVLSLGAGATIHGRIRTASGAPPPSGRRSASLQPVNEDELGFGWTEINKDGTFEFDGIADGSYTLQTYVEQGWFVKSAHVGNEDVLQNGVQVENGAAKGSLDIVISNEGSQVEGSVTDSDKNQPLAGVQVRVRIDPETEYNGHRLWQEATDQNGHYVIKDVPPGKYKVVAKIPSSGGGAPAIKSEPAAVTLGEREHRTVDIKLALPKTD